MIGSGFNFNITNPSGGNYAIPTSKNTLIHVNANDLYNSTAQIGPAWTKSGTITFQNGGLSGLGTQHVILWGRDGSGNGWLQVDNNTSISQAAPMTLSAASNNLGTNISGNIFELMLSTDTPSSGAFTALYNKIVANGG